MWDARVRGDVAAEQEAGRRLPELAVHMIETTTEPAGR